MRTRNLTRRAGTFAALVSLATAGCGGVLTGTDPGPPLAQLHGTVTDSTPTPLASPYVELLWALPVVTSGGTTPVPLGVENALVPIQSQFPSSFTLDLYQPPPDALISDVKVGGSNDLRFALATVVVFDDINRNGNFDLVGADGKPTSAFALDDSFAPDVLRGWLAHGAVMYVAELPASTNPTLSLMFANPEALRPGFQTITVCHVAGTAADTRYQVTPADAPLSLHLVEPTTTVVQESQPLWYADAASLPDCTP